jgi:hypothetical protein
MKSSKGEQNTPRSDVAGMSPERANRPLSDVAPEDSAGMRGHGAHGSGGRHPAEHVDEVATEPDLTKEGARGSAGWGSAASGGSTIDKRGPDSK